MGSTAAEVILILEKSTFFPEIQSLVAFVAAFNVVVVDVDAMAGQIQLELEGRPFRPSAVFVAVVGR